MQRILIGLLVLALLPVAAGCGDSDSSSGSASSPKTSDETSAQPPASDALELDADEQSQLQKTQQEFASYCDDKGAKPVGSAAIVESLLTYGMDTQTADGTLGDVVTKEHDALRKCGAKDLARRLDEALKAAP